MRDLTGAGRCPLVWELVGPAAVGKSALAGALGERCRTIRTVPGVHELPRALLAVHLLRTLPTCFRLYRGRRWSVREEMKHIVRLETLHRVLGGGALKGCRAVVLDEGPVYALTWLDVFRREDARAPSFEKWWHGALQRWAEVVDAIIWLDAPDAVLVERIRSREKPHAVKDKDERVIQRFLESYRASYERVISGLTAVGGPRVLNVTADGESPDQLSGRVLTALTAGWDGC